MSKLKPPVGDNDQYSGNKNAKIILVEYGDYQCPHCGHAHPLIKRLLKEMEGDIHFVFRNFPLSEVHPAAMMAALAAEAAGKQDKFWQMHDIIFDHQENLHGNSFVDFAEKIGLDLQQFARDWKDEDTSAKVEGDFESGIRSGVNGTPTFFVNGEKLVSYDSSYESLLEGVKAFL